MILQSEVTRDALLYSDGSLTVFAEHRAMCLIRREREDADQNAPPSEWTKIVRVACRVTEVLEDPAAAGPAPVSEVERLRSEVAELHRRLAEFVSAGRGTPLAV